MFTCEHKLKARYSLYHSPDFHTQLFLLLNFTYVNVELIKIELKIKTKKRYAFLPFWSSYISDTVKATQNLLEQL